MAVRRFCLAFICYAPFQVFVLADVITHVSATSRFTSTATMVQWPRVFEDVQRNQSKGRAMATGGVKKRLSELEAEVARLRAKTESGQVAGKRWWEQISGT